MAGDKTADERRPRQGQHVCNGCRGFLTKRGAGPLPDHTTAPAPRRPPPWLWPQAYLVSLVDAVDELLRWRVPQELDGGGVHGFHLHILRGRGRHCSRTGAAGGRQEARGAGREETLSRRSRLTSTLSAASPEGAARFWKRIVMLQQERAGLLLTFCWRILKGTGRRVDQVISTHGEPFLGGPKIDSKQKLSLIFFQLASI